MNGLVCVSDPSLGAVRALGCLLGIPALSVHAESWEAGQRKGGGSLNSDRSGTEGQSQDGQREAGGSPHPLVSAYVRPRTHDDIRRVAGAGAGMKNC